MYRKQQVHLLILPEKYQTYDPKCRKSQLNFYQCKLDLLHDEHDVEKESQLYIQEIQVFRYVLYDTKIEQIGVLESMSL